MESNKGSPNGDNKPINNEDEKEIYDLSTSEEEITFEANLHNLS